MQFFWPFILALVLSLILTSWVRKIALKHNIIDQPGGRRVHEKPTARLGGVAIFGSFLLTILVLIVFNRDAFDFISQKFLGLDKAFFGLLLGAIILVVVGTADDIWQIKPWQKFIGQIIAVLVAVGFGVGITYLNLPAGGALHLDKIILSFQLGSNVHHLILWAALFAVAWMLVMINALNFLDGLDGLAGGVSLIAMLVLFVLSIGPRVNQPDTALICIVLAGAILGFLPFNFNPAKIFMGDSGSMFLGFMLAAIAIISGGKVATALLVLGLPLIDSAWVVISRLVAKKSPFVADQNHLHHRLLRAGLSVRQAVVLLYFISAVFGILALEFESRDKFLALIWLLVLILILALSLVVLERRKKGREGHGV